MSRTDADHTNDEAHTDTDDTAGLQGENPAADRHSDQRALDEEQDPTRTSQVPADFDVEEPTGSGEPVHHNTGGDVGEGAD